VTRGFWKAGLFCFALLCFCFILFCFFDARSCEIGTGQYRLGGINSDSTRHDGDSSKAKLREDTQHQALRSDWRCLVDMGLPVYLFICLFALKDCLLGSRSDLLPERMVLG
jgi:hypothetical protein